MGGNVFALDRQLFTRTIWRVWVSAAVFAMGALCHGIDSQMFGSLQTLTSYLNSFGTITVKGKAAFTTEQLSLLNSVPWLGKFVGVFLFTLLVDPFGYRKGLILACVIQAIGVTMEMAGKNWQTFCAGRTVIYAAMGVYENVAPLYVAEIAPPQYRGFFLALYPIMNSFGGILNQVTVKAVELDPSPAAWLTCCAIQFAPFAIILAGIWFCPESPRWLMQRGRRDAAYAGLKSLRTAEDAASGWVELEIESISQQIEIEKLTNTGGWIDCFRGTNLRRTIIVIHLWVGNQWSGNQFMNSFAPTLYVALGRTAEKYTYQIIYSVCGLVSQMLAGVFIDKLGRRPILIGGCALMSFFLMLLGGLGTLPKPSEAALNTMVACVVLFKFFLACSLQEMNHTMSAEMPALQLRRKTNSIGTSIDVVAAFAVTYSSPYLLSSPGANLGAKVGFIFGCLCAYFCVYSIFFVPEMKGRSLEEIDELFEAKLWAWQFDKYQCRGTGAAISAHDAGQATNREQQLASDARQQIPLDDKYDGEDQLEIK